MGTIVTVPIVSAPTENFPVLNVANGIVPDEALAITCNLQFSPTAQAILIDLTESARKFSTIPIQGAFVDMSGSAIDMRLENPASGQSILAKASLQGYYNLLSPMPQRFIAVLASAPAAALNITVIFYNTVIESEVWGLTSGPAGPAGPQGPPGATGATGPQGPAGPAGVIASVQNQGTLVTPARAILNFTGAGVTATDDSANTRTNITIPGTPIATATVLGGVKIGTNVSVAGDGTISVPAVAAFQTPWLTSINGATNSLTNVNTVSANNYSYAGTTANPSVEQWLMNGSIRWRWSTVAPESGSNAGSNLQLQGYADDGSTILGLPIQITRSTEFVGIGGVPSEALTVAGAARITGQQTTNVANALSLDFYPLNQCGRFLATGPNTTTYSGFEWVISHSDGSSFIIPLVIGNGGGSTGGLGYVGMGTINPIYLLDMRTSAPVPAQLHISSSNADTGFYLSSYSATNVMLGDYTFDGTTATAKSTTGVALYLNGSGMQLGFNSGLTVGAAFTPTTIFSVNPTLGGAVGIGVAVPTHALQMVVDDAVKPTTNTWTIASGAKVKRNVKRLKGGLDIINKLSPTEAEYNGKGGTKEGQRVVSLIAEEVRKILPHSVTEDKDGNLGFNVHEVIHHLILAVQQLSKKLESMEGAA